MKNTTATALFALAFSFLLLAGCKKENDSATDPNNNSASFFIEGRGLRKIHEVNHPSSGNFSGFGSATMMLEGNTLDWIFAWYSSANSAYGYEPYRRRININTGDTLANPGVPAGNPLLWLVSPDNYYSYANGTNELCWRNSSQGLSGEAEGLPFSNFGEGKVYDNGQLFSGYPNNAYTGFSGGMHTKPVSARFRRNGILLDTNYLIRNNVGPE